mmetsp:Transcript_36372/g.121782  ORF Transcript_36372/g.121782 Transcript_36372/m.121782 type:complete len:222 (+) Transcript_36372:474-1139(+)
MRRSCRSRQPRAPSARSSWPRSARASLSERRSPSTRRRTPMGRFCGRAARSWTRSAARGGAATSRRLCGWVSSPRPGRRPARATTPSAATACGCSRPAGGGRCRRRAGGRRRAAGSERPLPRLSRQSLLPRRSPTRRASRGRQKRTRSSCGSCPRRAWGARVSRPRHRACRTAPRTPSATGGTGWWPKRAAAARRRPRRQSDRRAPSARRRCLSPRQPPQR